jgi:small subunit ribosomal protein S3
LGHKVHPLGFRIGVIYDWQAKWYADKHFRDNLQEDIKLRQVIQAKYAQAGVSLVEIERQAKEVSITIHTAWPGVVIGRGGQRVDEMRLYLENLIGKRVRLTIREIQQPELDAYLVAKTIAEQIERRVAYRRAIKQAIFRTIQAGAKGVRVSCAGRLGGAEIARRQTMHQGRVPLHTLRADIDYGFTEARTTLGRIGVKVWIYRGDIRPEPKVEEMPAEPVVSEKEEIAPPAEPAEKVAKPAARRRTRPTPAAQPEEIPAEPVVSERVEVVPSAEPAEKAAKPVARRRTRPTPAAEPVVSELEKIVPPAEPEEKAAKPVARRRTRPTPAAQPEEKDVTTETGEIPQES